MKRTTIAMATLLCLVCGGVSWSKPASKKNPTAAAKTVKGKLTAKQLVAAQASLKSLRKLQSALKSGVNILDFSRRITDAQIEIDEATSALPKSDLKANLEGAMEQYVLVRDLSTIIEGHDAEANEIVMKEIRFHSGIAANLIESAAKLMEKQK